MDFSSLDSDNLPLWLFARAVLRRRIILFYFCAPVLLLQLGGFRLYNLAVLLSQLDGYFYKQLDGFCNLRLRILLLWFRLFSLVFVGFYSVNLFFFTLSLALQTSVAFWTSLNNMTLASGRLPPTIVSTRLSFALWASLLIVSFLDLADSGHKPPFGHLILWFRVVAAQQQPL